MSTASGVTNPYGKVYSSFWTSETTGQLSDDGKLLALYLMTCPHRTIAGVFRLSFGYVADDLSWGSERVAEGFAELSRNGFARHCEATKWVWIEQHLAWNPPENPNQRTAIRRVALSVPGACSWRRDFLLASASLLELPAEVLDPPPSDAEPKGSATLSEGFPNQQQQQQQHSATATAAAAAGGDAAPDGSTTHSAGADAPPAPAKAERGTRLSKDWALPKPWGDWALERYHHLTAEQVRALAESFRNHWCAKTGKDATKLDWRMTWENWVAKDAAPGGRFPPPRNTVGSVDESRAKAERLQQALRAGGGAVKPASTLEKLNHG